MKKRPFNMGDIVIPTENYEDEQLGHFAYMGEQQINAFKRAPDAGTSGWWIQTDRTHDWVDAAWFKLVKKRRTKR